MKRKLVLLLLPLFFLVGCEIGNTPTSKIESLLMKYQKLDTDINNGINDILDIQDMSEAQKERYRNLLEKQYKNLTYKIKDELIDGDNATVVVEIEVLDYRNAIGDLVFDSSIYTKETYDDEKLNRLENATGKVTYTLELGLSKDSEGNWKVLALTNEDIKKIQGMY